MKLKNPPTVRGRKRYVGGCTPVMVMVCVMLVAPALLLTVTVMALTPGVVQVKGIVSVRLLTSE